jgi:hypothetical protein
MSIKWNAKKLLSQLQESVESPGNKRRFLEEPHAALEAAASGGSAALVSEFRMLSDWLAVSGVCELFGDPHSAMRSLSQSVYFAAGYYQLVLAIHRVHPECAGTGDGADAALSLARCVTIGCDSTAHDIASTILQDPNGVIYGIKSTRIPAFIFSLYSRNAALALPEEIAKVPIREPYSELLTVWDTDDVERLSMALVAACDFHVERSREHNNREYFEFCTENYRLQPVEILMVLRMRESLGLENPVIDHPIMNTPAGKLYPIIDVEPDPIIAPALAAALAYHDARAKRLLG